MVKKNICGGYIKVGIFYSLMSLLAPYNVYLSICLSYSLYQVLEEVS